MAAHAKQIEVVDEDRPVLEKWAGARATERRLVDRARIVLLAGEGRPASEIAGDGGHGILPVGGHRKSPLAVVGSPRWWPAVLPMILS